MTSGGNTLHDSWLTCCDHHITGRLTKVVSQNCKERNFHINKTAFIVFDTICNHRSLDVCTDLEISKVIYLTKQEEVQFPQCDFNEGRAGQGIVIDSVWLYFTWCCYGFH